MRLAYIVIALLETLATSDWWVKEVFTRDSPKNPPGGFSLHSQPRALTASRVVRPRIGNVSRGALTAVVSRVGGSAGVASRLVWLRRWAVDVSFALKVCLLRRTQVPVAAKVGFFMHQDIVVVLES